MKKIKAGNVIVGLAGFGQSTYESTYNSGIGSNGLTSARHDILNKFYAETYKESYDNSLNDDVLYIGKHKLIDLSVGEDHGEVNIGQLLLSPTRTFAPLIKILLENHFDKIHGLIHCSGGGQTKCLKYIPGNVKIIKDNLFEPPVIFKLIKEASKADDKEMCQVFNMGCRMEIYTDENFAANIIFEAKKFNIDAQIIGRAEASEKKELLIKTKDGELVLINILLYSKQITLYFYLYYNIQ